MYLECRGDLPFIGSQLEFRSCGRLFACRRQPEGQRNSEKTGSRCHSVSIPPSILTVMALSIILVMALQMITTRTFSFAQALLLATSGLDNPGLAVPDLLPGCVPVDLFTGSSGPADGDFATAAERDYVSSSYFDTTYEQVFITAFVTGDLFELPAGSVGVVLGAEWREDSIQSELRFISSNGLFFALPPMPGRRVRHGSGNSSAKLTFR